MKRTTTLLLTIALTFLLPSSEAFAGKGNGKPRPFKAEFTTEFFNSNVTPLGVFTTVVEGTGNATHLGEVALVGVHNFSFTDFTNPFLGGPAYNGELVLTAANGDVLNATYGGDISFLGDPIFPFLIEFTITFDGGTGRFENATGEASCVGLTTIVPVPDSPLFTGTSQFVFEGEISY